MLNKSIDRLTQLICGRKREIYARGEMNRKRHT
jgi:hypothetical protein